MTTELIIKTSKQPDRVLYSNHPMTKQHLKKAGASQTYVGGSWSTYDEAEVVEGLRKLGYTLTDTPPSVEPHDWRDDPATDKQMAYLVSLGIRTEPNMTKARASQLIDAHKYQGSVGHVGGWYADGSN